jgi:hypothetical protein
MVETSLEDFVDDAELHAYAQHTLICPRSCTELHTHNMDEANKNALNDGSVYQKQIFTKDPKLSRKDKQRSCTISSRPMHSDSKSIRYTQKATSLNRLNPCLCQGCARPRTKEPLMNPGIEGIGLDTYPLGIGPDIRPILLSNEALDSETLERFTTWGFVTEEILAALPAELVDPLRALENAMAALHHACGATALNVVFNILTLSAWGNLRASEAGLRDPYRVAGGVGSAPAGRRRSGAVGPLLPPLYPHAPECPLSTHGQGAPLACDRIRPRLLARANLASLVSSQARPCPLPTPCPGTPDLKPMPK